jgi:Protein of unknown function (DUF2946)
MGRAMEEMVFRGTTKWPQVPDVYGWLSLDRRGNFLLKGGKIENRALREYISRNYRPDARGCWYFQNGPQRVFVSLAYTPLVLHFEGEAIFDHCGRLFAAGRAFLDEEGSVLVAGAAGIGLLDDRDLARYADQAEHLPRIARQAVPGRFGFVVFPAPDPFP